MTAKDNNTSGLEFSLEEVPSLGEDSMEIELGPVSGEGPKAKDKGISIVMTDAADEKLTSVTRSSPKFELSPEDINPADETSLQSLPDLTSLGRKSPTPSSLEGLVGEQDNFNVDEHSAQGGVLAPMQSVAMVPEVGADEVAMVPETSFEMDAGEGATKMVNLAEIQATLTMPAETPLLEEEQPLSELAAPMEEDLLPQDPAQDFQEGEALLDARDQESEAPVVPEPLRISTPPRVERIRVQASENVRFEYDQNEMVRVQASLRHMRQEREALMAQVSSLKERLREHDGQNLSSTAALDEVRIENSILKKRHADQIRELNEQVLRAQEKRDLLESKLGRYQAEIQKLNEKVRLDFTQIKRREKELEGQLELISMDTASQLQGRDAKIMELKRKIDALEFNMENAVRQEQRARDDKMRLEERLAKIMNTLRDSIQILEEEREEEGARVLPVKRVGDGKR